MNVMNVMCLGEGGVSNTTVHGMTTGSIAHGRSSSTKFPTGNIIINAMRPGGEGSPHLGLLNRGGRLKELPHTLLRGCRGVSGGECRD